MALRSASLTFRNAVWSLCAVLLISCASAGISPRPQEAAPVRAVIYQPTELQFNAQAPLTARFVSPSGRALRALSFQRGKQRVVRFTPTEPGIWHYQALASNHVVAEGNVAAESGNSHGFVRAQGHAFVFDDGAPFIALGENRINIYDASWNWKALPADRYIRYMAEHGMTVLRVFIVSDIENEERGGTNAGVLEPVLGRFDERVAAQFDGIFREAEADGVYVVLVAFALGFSQDDAWKSWQDNPYAKERGGPAATRYEFFESAAVRARAAERLRYLAARYAASPSLLAIDLLNEPEWDGAIPEASWVPWAREMARIWHDADPYHHLVTVGSVGLHWNIEGDERAWWASEECDVVQWHLYGKEVYEVHALAAEMTRKVRETWSYEKPVLVGEFAYGGEPKPEYDHTHAGLWSATFSGAGVLAHSAPPFNVDSDELMTPERARHFRVLRNFLEGLPILTPGEATATQGVSAWTLLAENAGAVWLLAPKEGYGKAVAGTRVVIRGAGAGRWRAHWVDDVTGAPLGDSDATRQADTLELIAPSFSKHVAARLERITAP